MPFLQAAATARRCRMLCYEYRMPFEGRLFSIIYRLGRSEPACDEILSVLEDRGHSFLSQVVELLCTELEVAAERRTIKSDENLAEISHARRATEPI